MLCHFPINCLYFFRVNVASSFSPYRRSKNQPDPYWCLATQQKNEKHLDFPPETNNNPFLNNTGIGGESIKFKNDLEKRKKMEKKNGRSGSSTLTSTPGTLNPLFVSSSLTEVDHTLLKKHPSDVVALCYRCYDKFKDNLRETIKDFKAHQIVGLRGKILDHLFLSILRKHGIALNVWESPKITHSFRVFGMRGVTDFAEFLKVCQLAR